MFIFFLICRILELQADAFFEQRKEVWWSQMVSCPKEDDSSTGLPFKNLSGVFILTGAGFATGFLMLGIECIVFKWKKRKVKLHWVKSNVLISKYIYQECDHTISSSFFQKDTCTMINKILSFFFLFFLHLIYQISNYIMCINRSGFTYYLIT